MEPATKATDGTGKDAISTDGVKPSNYRPGTQFRRVHTFPDGMQVDPDDSCSDYDHSDGEINDRAKVKTDFGKKERAGLRKELREEKEVKLRHS